MATKPFKAAVIQASPVLFDKEKTIEKVGKLTAEAAAKGAQLIVFPEAFISAYPKAFKFERPEFLRYFESAIQIPGPDITKLQEIAKKNNVYLVIGVIERDGGTLYCTAVFFSPGGEFMGKHRKLMPTDIERVVWGRGDASTMPVFDTPLGKLGAVICWENYMPLVRTTMYNKGIQLYVALNADGTDGWQATARHVAMEGRCFVFSCNQMLRRKAYMEQNIDCIDGGGDPNDIIGVGGSTIVNPLGDVIAGPNMTDECILVADINLDEIAKGQLDFDVVGHYSRPDIFTLYVDDSPRSNVVLSSENQNGHRHGQKFDRKA